MPTLSQVSGDNADTHSTGFSVPRTTLEVFSRYNPEHFSGGELTEWEQTYSCASRDHTLARGCTIPTLSQPCRAVDCIDSELRIGYQEPVAIFGAEADRSVPAYLQRYHVPNSFSHPDVGRFEAGEAFLMAATTSDGDYKRCINCESVLAAQEFFSELVLELKAGYSRDAQAGTADSVMDGPEGEVLEITVCGGATCQSIITPYVERLGLKSEWNAIEPEWVEDAQS